MIDSGESQQAPWHLQSRRQVNEQAAILRALLPSLDRDCDELNIFLEAAKAFLAEKNGHTPCGLNCLLDLREHVAEGGQVLACHPDEDIGATFSQFDAYFVDDRPIEVVIEYDDLLPGWITLENNIIATNCEKCNFGLYGLSALMWRASSSSAHEQTAVSCVPQRSVILCPIRLRPLLAVSDRLPAPSSKGEGAVCDRRLPPHHRGAGGLGLARAVGSATSGSSGQ
jgi:hypothetical protein